MAVTTSLSKAFESKILKCLKGTEELAKPTTWVALYTTSPSRTAAGTEAAYTGYKRIKVEASKWELVEATGAAEGEEGYIKNTEKIEFPECTAGESKVKSAALCTAESAGEQIVWGELTEEKTISTTNTPASFAAGTLKFKLN